LHHNDFSDEGGRKRFSDNGSQFLDEAFHPVAGIDMKGHKEVL
jgi:hypothetical protein